MPAYWIGRVKVNDPDQYKKYADQVPAILAEHGGKVLARGGRFQICMSSEHFGPRAGNFKRVSGSSGLKVQAAIACWCRRRLCSMVFRLMVSLRLSMAGALPK
jgi:hypothetical protein